ncbi:hypothetical protein DBV05_g7591 [Lasiodiplodia theobromae]|nr:hypothetical protein DBV05_g7591 [Lasiodiplodia theobromae]
MREHSHGSEKGVDTSTQDLLKSLEAKSHDPPNEPQYDDAEALEALVTGLSSKNEVMVIHELHDLVCPPAERLHAIYFEDERLSTIYKKFVDYRDEPWTQPSQLIAGFPDPKPDYCVGFNDEAFDEVELYVLATVPNIMSSFTAAGNIYFPFLTCEAKAPKEWVKYAENQNAYAMMVAVSSTFDLFQAAGMEHSVHRKVLGFSISYNDSVVVVDGYYPVVTGQGLSIYRTRRIKMSIPPTDSDTRRSWRFVRNIYEVWAPQHLASLKKAIKAVQSIGNVAGSGSRGSQTPTPSEATHRRLQQLGLQSSRPQAARVDNDSVSSNQSRAGGVPIGPPDSVAPKRHKTAAV